LLTPDDVWPLRHRAFRTALAIVGQRELAEDIVQDVLVKALDHGEPVWNVEAWVRTLVVRASLNALRRPTPQILASDPTDNATFEDAVLVRDALAKLSPESRTILALAYFESLNHREIAELLDVPEGTVASRLHTARAAFQKEWNR
jgi:RNA polymerase sigma-70 factor (ECF subfamily)